MAWGWKFRQNQRVWRLLDWGAEPLETRVVRVSAESVVVDVLGKPERVKDAEMLAASKLEALGILLVRASRYLAVVERATQRARARVRKLELDFEAEAQRYADSKHQVWRERAAS